jgi:hypothetical protein
VLAGTNGAGKSSIAGARFRESGGAFNPDEAARRILAADPVWPGRGQRGGRHHGGGCSSVRSPGD